MRPSRSGSVKSGAKSDWRARLRAAALTPEHPGLARVVPDDGMAQVPPESGEIHRVATDEVGLPAPRRRDAGALRLRGRVPPA